MNYGWRYRTADWKHFPWIHILPHYCDFIDLGLAFTRALLQDSANRAPFRPTVVFPGLVISRSHFPHRVGMRGMSRQEVVLPVIWVLLPSAYTETSLESLFISKFNILGTEPKFSNTQLWNKQGNESQQLG